MTVHVAGAGLAGLAAALTAAGAGHRVVVHEAAGAPGGRCRSFKDPVLRRWLDNGTHVVLGGNRVATEFITAMGGANALQPAGAEALLFFDHATGDSWTVPIGSGAARAVVSIGGLRALCALLPDLFGAARSGTVAQAYRRAGPAYARLIAPFAKAVFNRAPCTAPAKELSSVMRRLARGGRGALRPYLAPTGLSQDWVAPAVTALEALGGEVRYHDPLETFEVGNGTLRAATFRSGQVRFADDDALILALPPWALRDVAAGFEVPPFETSAIVCAHFLVSPAPALAGGSRLLGVSGATAEWLAVRGDVLSVTVSAADRLLPLELEEIAAVLWRDAAAALGLDCADVPLYRVVKERRATARIDAAFGPRTGVDGLLIAGGWTSSALPDTIEAAVESGIRAAALMAPLR